MSYLFFGAVIGVAAAFIGAFIGSAMKASQPEGIGFIVAVIAAIVVWNFFPPATNVTNGPGSLGDMAANGLNTATYWIDFTICLVGLAAGAGGVIWLVGRSRFR